MFEITLIIECESRKKELRLQLFLDLKNWVNTNFINLENIESHESLGQKNK